MSLCQCCRKRSAPFGQIKDCFSLLQASNPSGSLSSSMCFTPSSRQAGPVSYVPCDFTRTRWLQPRCRLGPCNLARSQLAGSRGAGSGGQFAAAASRQGETVPGRQAGSGLRAEPRGTLCSLLIHPFCWRQTRSTLARCVSCGQGRRGWSEKGGQGNLSARLCECWKTF